MHKKELIYRIKKFVESLDSPEKPRWSGQEPFARFLVYYLENLNIPEDEKYDFWNIIPHLPQILIDAFEELRTGEDEEIKKFRSYFESTMNESVPNITDIGESDLVSRSLTAQTVLGFMMREVVEQEAIEKNIRNYTDAQIMVAKQYFDKFSRLVWRKGMRKVFDASDSRGMSAKFGDTYLRTFVLAGRIMITFARKYKDEKNAEMSVSFVAEDGDTLLLSAGMQSAYADLHTIIYMIEDVINGWPKEKELQNKIYKADKNISLG